MSAPAARARQQGIAALTAILVVAIATVLAVNLLWHTSVDISRTETLLTQDQARQYDLGAEELGKVALAQDWRDDGEGGADFISTSPSDELWSQPFLRQFEAGTLVAQITDQQGRFDLNSLLTSNGSRDDEKAKQYARLLALLKLDQPLDPEALTDATIDWIDPDTYAGSNGAEDDVYTNREPPYRPANFWFVSTSELLAIQGYTPEIYAALERYVTALPPPANGEAARLLNVNTAEDAVLESLVDGASGAAIPKLPRGPYTDVGDFLSDSNLASHTELTGKLGFSSSWFLLTVSTSVGETRSTMYSLLERNDDVVRVRLRSFDAN